MNRGLLEHKPGPPSQDQGRIAVIDPGMRRPEVECFNLLARLSPIPCTYHLPALWGMSSLKDEPIEHLKAVVILGSAASVHDRHPWQLDLEAWLSRSLGRAGGLPTLGLCYGHQLLAAMAGGRVGFLRPDQSKARGLRQVTLSERPPWLGDTEPLAGPLVVSHRETVTEAPSTMVVFASSGEVATDGLRSRLEPLWTFQAHPEASPAFVVENAVPGVELGRDLSFGHALMAGFLRHYGLGFSA